MPFCFAPRCSHTSRRESCTFFRFPKEKKDFKIWENMCRRSDKVPTREDRLCSCHFINGEKNRGPTIFSWNEKLRMNFSSPEKGNRKKGSLDKSLCNTTGLSPNTSGLSPDTSGLSPKSDTAVPELSAQHDTSVTNIQSDITVSESSSQPDIAVVSGSSVQCDPTLLETFAGNHKESQTSFTNILLESELYFLKEENKQLKQMLDKGEGRMSFRSISYSDSLVFQYTGLPSSAHFVVLFRLLGKFPLNYYLGWNVTVLSLDDQLLMALMKLRLNLYNFDLAYRFKVSQQTVRNVVTTVVYALHEILFSGMMDAIPSRGKNSLFLPECFSYFPNCRIVLDCTEFEIEVPYALNVQKSAFSHYKQRHTFKVLIGISPNACITFVSKLFPGSVSDKRITKESGLLEMLDPGDLIIADKGFLINDLCQAKGILLNIPPFLSNPQFTVQEALATVQIARARVHVERAIGRLKNFRIVNFLPHTMREHSTVIIQTCAALVNLQYSLLKENDQCVWPSQNDA